MKNYRIKAKDYNDVIVLFITRHDNRTETIAKELKLSYPYVNCMIDFHLSLKRNSMSEPIVMKNPNRRFYGTKIKVTDQDGDSNEFISIQKACDFYNVNRRCVILGNNKSITVKHYNGKVLTYTKI